tara:strand:+ start:292 stop:969 length:678 start_codon:yes stop_codon:yes gene_type:complete
MQKIIVFGFPHCGTTILRSIIGHSEEVFQICDEIKKIKINTDKPFIVCKYPFMDSKFFTQEYNDYIKIFIIRNPLFVYTSINKRFIKSIPHDYHLLNYEKVAEQFIKCKEENIPNIYTIKYEELFDNNYSNIRNILDSIGINYSDDIFNNALFRNKVSNNFKTIPKDVPRNADHNNYRMYQINQPIENFNDENAIDLKPEQINYIKNSNIINKLYPDIKKIYKLY